MTEEGRKSGYRIAYELAVAGAVVVSGMAIGIDGVSHAGSLAAGGVNIAFLGCGIDICYPSVHLRLAREIVKSGCILTEYPPHSRPERYNFPKRNRLIAALSSAVVVIEGTEKSGSLITAEYAKEYGKNVYALPGNVDNKTSEATNLLIKNGAKLITNADDVIIDLETSLPGMLNQHNLSTRSSFDMNEVLTELEISCVSAGDTIFSAFRSRREKKRAEKALRNSEAAEATEREKALPDERKLDDASLHVYRRIPVDTDIAVDELPDDTVDMKGVMRALLKLEMGHFIVMLPGERVKRNI
jgi:DNA protecting protein DprA